MLDAAEGEGFQGVANDVFFQVKGAVVLRAVDEGQVDGEATVTASIEYRRKNRAASRGKTGATPYFLFSENRELYRLFRPTGRELYRLFRATGRNKRIGSCPPFWGELSLIFPGG